MTIHENIVFGILFFHVKTKCKLQGASKMKQSHWNVSNEMIQKLTVRINQCKRNIFSLFQLDSKKTLQLPFVFNIRTKNMMLLSSGF